MVNLHPAVKVATISQAGIVSLVDQDLGAGVKTVDGLISRGTVSATGAVSGSSVSASGSVSGATGSFGSVSATTISATGALSGASLALSGAITGATSGTFSGTVNAANLSGTNSGDLTTLGVNGLSIVGQVIALASAGASQNGAMTTAAQTLAGSKTWTGTADFQAGLTSTTIGASGRITSTVAAGSVALSLLSDARLSFNGGSDTRYLRYNGSTYDFVGAKVTAISWEATNASGSNGYEMKQGTRFVTDSAAGSHYFYDDGTNLVVTGMGVSAPGYTAAAGGRFTSLQAANSHGFQLAQGARFTLDGGFDTHYFAYDGTNFSLTEMGLIAPTGSVTAASFFNSYTALTTPVNATHTTATTGGTLAPGTYWYQVTALIGGGESLASTPTSIVVPAGTSTNRVSVNWSAVTGATGYVVYGRSAGTSGSGVRGFMATVGAVTTWSDTGAITPSTGTFFQTSAPTSVSGTNGAIVSAQVAGEHALMMNDSVRLGWWNSPGQRWEYLDMIGGGFGLSGGLQAPTLTSNGVLASYATGTQNWLYVNPGPRASWNGGYVTQTQHNDGTNLVTAGMGLSTSHLTTYQVATPVNSTHTNATTGGTLAPGTYGYRVAALSNNGTTLASTSTAIVVPAGTSTNAVTVKWAHVLGAVSYNVYGRTSGSELLIANVLAGTAALYVPGAVTTFVDTGSITPSGALPTANTTGRVDLSGIPSGTSAVRLASGARISFDSGAVNHLSVNGVYLESGQHFSVNGVLKVFTRIDNTGYFNSTVVSGAVAYYMLQGARFITNSAAATHYFSDNGTNLLLTGMGLDAGANTIATTGSVNADTAVTTALVKNNSTTLIIRGAPNSSSTAVANQSRAGNALTHAGSMIHSFSAFNGTHEAWISHLGGLRTNGTNNTLPAASALWRGQLLHGPDAASLAPDVLYYCGKKSDDTYAWVPVVTMP